MMNRILSCTALKTCSSMLRMGSYSTKATNVPLEKCVLMSDDRKYVVCYHPEEEHPFEFSKPIERKIESERPLKTNITDLYKKRFDSKVPTNNKEFWFDSLRLAKTFNENPMKFKLPRRSERIRAFMRSKLVKKREAL